MSPYYGVFVQDNIKLASNLSMNAGLRYEFQHLQAASVSNPQFPRTAQVPEDKNNFAPRLAFAWQPREKLVIRTSYGIYYGVIPVQTEAVARTQNGALQSVRVFQGSGAPGAPQYPQVLSAVPGPQTPLPGAKIAVFSPDFVNPYIQQVNLEVEREIGANFSVSSGWLYTKGTRLRSNEDLNLFPPGTRTIQVNDTARNFSGLFTAPYFGGPASRPFPFFDQIDEFRFDNNSVYHAFFVQLNKRYSRGLQFLFNYTVSKLIDRGQAPGNQFTCCTSDNPFDPGGERGLGLRDQRNRFNFASVWDLPGVATQNALARNVLRGWRLNSILHAGSGRPLTPTVAGDAGGDVNGDGIRGDRAPFFGRNTIIFPGNAAVDLALHRVFSKEGKTFDIGLEAFNVFNRANYLRPPTDYYIMTNVPGGITRLDGPIPSFDKPTTALPSRQLQVILRFSF